jgi:hypothetical protein
MSPMIADYHFPLFFAAKHAARELIFAIYGIASAAVNLINFHHSLGIHSCTWECMLP